MKDAPTHLMVTDNLSMPTSVPSRKELRLTPISQRVSPTTRFPTETIKRSNTYLFDQSERTLQNVFAIANDPSSITLLPTSVLPDRLRLLFPFEYFNAMQSKAFQSIYQFDNNIVVSAPTGSGKTTCFEFAIAKLLRTIQQPGTYKVSVH
jgi:ATP-dependent DNA helicase HFM1/MER3